MKIDTLRAFYIEELRDLHSAENQSLKVMPRMATSSSSPGLRKLFEAHIDETRVHVERLDLILEGLKADPAEKYCRAMEGILVEVMAVLVVDMPDTVRDAALIAAAQRIEHYEIAAYGCVRTYARLLGEHEAAGLLQESLRDEGDVDKWLTELAEESINTDASTEVAAA